MQHKALFFNNKGYISTPFKVKNAIATSLRWKRKYQFDANPNKTDIAHSLIRNNSKTIPDVKLKTRESFKPATAPDKINNLIDEAPILMGPVTPKILIEDDQEFETQQVPHRYAHFKSTIHQRKPLMFMKPYMRYQNQSLTIQQSKSEIYHQLKTSQIPTLDLNPPKLIEYMTEYSESFQTDRFNRGAGSARDPKGNSVIVKKTEEKDQWQIEKDKKRKPHQMSINVLRQKLKNKNISSVYRNKIRSMIFH